jgi:mono/diheme cytochrome c family protein
VIIMQHMETRANLTRNRAEMVRAFLLASNEAARRPGRQRGPLAAAPATGDVTIEMIEEGRRIFQGPGACISCHGADLGKGPVAPSLKDDRWRNGDGSLTDILEIVRNGVAGTAMPAYPAGISDEMARKVAAYVWAVSQGKAEP